MTALKDSVVCIVGLGQIGASIGRALVGRRACRRVVGVSRRAATLRAARRVRAADIVSRDLAGACGRADIVILAAPVRTILRLLPAAARAMRPGSLLLDVGGTKGEILRRAAPACRGRGVDFIGGHPMAGGVGRGPLSSTPRLFNGRPFVLVPAQGTRPRARALAADLVRALRARPIALTAEDHDAAVALVSHLPHVLALGLMQEAAADRRRLALRLAAGSFRSATRVAAGDPDLLLDIFLTNRRALGRATERYLARVRRIARAVRAGDEGSLRRWLEAARRARVRLDRVMSS